MVCVAVILETNGLLFGAPPVFAKKIITINVFFLARFLPVQETPLYRVCGWRRWMKEKQKRNTFSKNCSDKIRQNNKIVNEFEKYEFI